MRQRITFATTWLLALCCLTTFQLPNQSLFAADSEQTWVCSYDIATKESQKHFTIQVTAAIHSMIVSLDGRTVAYAGSLTKQDADHNSRIWTCGTDGTNLRDLGRGMMPSWSPGGHRLVFSRVAPEPGVWTMRADGSGQQILDHAGMGAAWSPNGKKIAWYRSIEGTDRIVTYDIAEDDFDLLAESVVVNRKGKATQIAWSPDSSRICLVDQTGPATIRFVIAPLTESSQRNPSFSQEAAPRSSVLWVDADRIVAGDRLHILTIDGSKSEDSGDDLVISGPMKNRRNVFTDVSRDGAKLFYLSHPAN